MLAQRRLSMKCQAQSILESNNDEIIIAALRFQSAYRAYDFAPMPASGKREIIADGALKIKESRRRWLKRPTDAEPLAYRGSGRQATGEKRYGRSRRHWRTIPSHDRQRRYRCPAISKSAASLRGRRQFTTPWAQRREEANSYMISLSASAGYQQLLYAGHDGVGDYGVTRIIVAPIAGMIEIKFHAAMIF